MIIIDYKNGKPIYEQVTWRFRELIIKGALKPGTQLPSVRNLAMDLSINPNTIQRAYGELEREGLIYTVKGKGSFIGDNEHLIDCRKEDIINNILNLVKESITMGITKDELMNRLSALYKEDEYHD